MSRPALATVSVLAIVGELEQLLLPLIVFTDSRVVDAAARASSSSSGQYSADTARILAYVILAMLPSLVFYAFAERQLIGGLTNGINKG